MREYQSIVRKSILLLIQFLKKLMGDYPAIVL